MLLLTYTLLDIWDKTDKNQMVNKNGTSKYHKARHWDESTPAFPIINSLRSASPGQCFSMPLPPQRRWGRRPQAAPGPHGVPGAEVNAKISVFWGRRQGGESRKKRKEAGRGRTQKDGEESGTRMLMRVETKEGRGERENIDLRQEKPKAV